MLSNPVLDNAVNPEACRAIDSASGVYEGMVKDCVEASKRVAGKLICYSCNNYPIEHILVQRNFFTLCCYRNSVT